jgi:hypothetical protein
MMANEYEEKLLDCDLDDYDFEVDATKKTTCGRLGRKHKMKRIHHSKTICIYPDCDGYC